MKRTEIQEQDRGETVPALRGVYRRASPMAGSGRTRWLHAGCVECYAVRRAKAFPAVKPSTIPIPWSNAVAATKPAP